MNDPHAEPRFPGGDMGRLVAQHPWAQTPLGPREGWQQSLHTAVGICLESRYPMAIWWGEQLIHIYNDAYRPILGDKHPRALGQRGDECWAEIWAAVGPLCAQVREEGRATWADDMLLEMDRHGFVEETYFTFSYSPIRDESGGVGGVLITCSETTARVLGERRLRLLSALGALAGGAESTAQACALAAEVMDGHSDLPWFGLYLASARGLVLQGSGGLPQGHPALPPRLEAGGFLPIDRVLKHGETVCAPAGPELDDDQGRAVPTNVMVLPLQSPGGDEPLGVLVAAISPRLALDEAYRDFLRLVAGHVTSNVEGARAFEIERRRAEALAELDRARTAFFTNISHELRTPLTLQLGPLEDALADPADPLPQVHRDRLELAHRNAQRLLRLVNTLLDFTRVDAGRAEASFVPVDLSSLTADLASTFRSAMERAGLAFEVRTPPLPQPVHVDPALWEQVVLNLLSNAFKYTLHGQITVEVAQTDHEALLHVSDTGVGIPEDELPRLFERFHRVRGQRGRSFEGTGIGLALAQELVQLHGGDIEVHSEVGRGSTFTVRLPLGTAHLPPDRIEQPAALPAPRTELSREAEQLVAPPEAPAQATSPDRILLVDDNADMRSYVGGLLRSRYAVEVLADGEAALASALAHPPALVLADVMMPGLDGFELLQALRDAPQTHTIPVILLSARAGEESRVEGLDAGADDYLVKPFTARELLARVGAHLELHLARRQVAERERAQREAAEREQHLLRELLEQAPAMTALLRGPDHVFEIANPPYVKAVRRTDAAALLGRPVREALPEVVEQGFIDLLDEVYRTGRPYHGRAVPLSLDLEDGGSETRWFDFVYQPLRGRSGEIEGILVQAVDLTEEVTARRTIEDRERQLRLITDALPALVARLDTDLRYAFANRAYLDWFGLEPQELIGRSMREVWGEQVYQGGLPQWRRAMAGEESHWETRVPDKDGVLRTVLASYRPDRDASGEIRGVVALVLDISERKASEEKLRRSEERYRLVSKATREVVWDWNLVEGGVAWNDALTEQFGHPNDATTADPEWWPTLMHPEDHDRNALGLRRAIEAGERLWSGEYRIRRRDGSWATVTDRCLVERDEDSRPLRVIGTIADVTEQRHAEARLREAQRMEAVGTLAGGVAHEVNNMMAAVIGFGELLLRRMDEQTPHRAEIGEMVAAAHRAAGITRQLLAFSRRQVLKPVVLDLNAVVRDLTRMLSRLTTPDVELVVDLSADEGRVLADKGQLEQVLVNLVLNARDAMPGGGRLTIATRDLEVDRAFLRAHPELDLDPGPCAVLEVADEGSGMDEATRARAFEPFFTTKPVGQGTGLGLSTVYGIVTQSGGRVLLESAPGLGTRVRLFMPLAKGELPRPVQPLRRAMGGTERVLVVEDEPMVRRLACTLLEDAGFQVSEARNGREGLTIVERGGVDVVVSDLVMPEMGGRELGRQIRERGLGVPVLYMSGYTGDHLIHQRLLERGMPFLQKPFSAEELLGAVRRLLDAPQRPEHDRPGLGT